MSPDDIFAANMWIWPDPLLKRDAMGRILFVNAAFLQLYGGRIENWAGNPIQGWPTPNGQAAPYRFETRIPSPNGEIVYDWVELTMADGNALAIARDVTIFQNPPPQGLPLGYSQNNVPENQAQASTEQARPEQMANYTHASANIAPQQAPADITLAGAIAQAPIAEAAPMALAPSFEPAIPAAPVAPVAPVAAVTAPPAMAETTSTPETKPIAAPIAQPATATALTAQDTPNFEMEAAPQHADEAPAAQTPIAQTPIAQTPIAQAEPIERDFERRALPIEDGNTILGSNWRDAVIARAVGADIEEEVAPAPVSLRVEDNEPQTDEADNPPQSLRILLAEDNAINALLTRTLLEAEGSIVETVEDGALAVQAMKDNMYDLIFMDMRMPNMDGLEATRKIRAMGARTADLPIIALTANAFDDDRNACFDSGMNDFMTKPVSAEELSQMVTTWTKKKNEAEAAA